MPPGAVPVKLVDVRIVSRFQSAEAVRETPRVPQVIGHESHSR